MAQIFGEQWQIVSDAGEGGQAHAFRVRRLSGDETEDEDGKFVLKRLKNQKRLGRFEQEIQALIELESSRIPEIVGYSAGDPAYLVTPYIGPTLAVEIKSRSLSFNESYDLFRDVVEAVVDAHRAGIAHRDIKPDNVVVTGGRAWLIDFGLCQIIDGEHYLTTVDEPLGNRSFAAPEMELGTEYTPGLHSDVYMLGKLLFWMLTGGQHILREDISDEVIERIPQPGGVERSYIRQLLEGVLRVNPGDRMVAEDLLAKVELAGRLMREGVSAVGSRDQLCMVCRQGTMLRLNRSAAVNAGIDAAGADTSYRTLRCTYCGWIRHHSIRNTTAKDLWEI